MGFIKLAKKLEIQERRKQVMDLARRKYTQNEIKDMLNISRRTVQTDMKAVQDEWREARIDDMNEVFLVDLLNLNRMEQLMWKRLESLSKDPRAGTRWMEMMLRLYDRRAKMLGYDAADKRIVRDMTLSVSHHIDKGQLDAAVNAALEAHKMVSNLIELPKRSANPDAEEEVEQYG